MRQIKAKFRAHTVNKTENGTQVKMHPVFSDDKSSENYSWSQATPSGNLDMFISNPDARDAFEEGKDYLLTFEEAQAPAVTPQDQAGDGAVAAQPE